MKWTRVDDEGLEFSNPVTTVVPKTPDQAEDKQMAISN